MFRKILFVALVFVCAACVPAVSKPSLATPESASPISTVPASTSTITPTVPPTETPTPTPTVAYPVSMNTPWPKPDKVIQPENIDQLVPLASWGYGLISDVAVSPDESKFVVATFTGFYIYDSQTLKISSTVATRSPVLTVTFSPDGKVLATGHSDNTIQLWDVSSPKLLQTLSFPFDESKVAPFDGVQEIRFTPDGRLLEVTGQLAFDEYVKLWEISSGKVIGAFDKISSCNLKIAPNGSEYALITPDTIQVFPISGGAVKSEHKIRNANQILYSPDGRMMAVVAGSVVNLINTADGSLIKKISGKAIEFLPDSSTTFVTSMDDGHIQMWSIDPDNAKVTLGKSFSGTGIGDAGRTKLYCGGSYNQNGAFAPDKSYIAVMKSNPPQGFHNQRLLIFQISDNSLANTILVPPDGYENPYFKVNKVLLSQGHVITLSGDFKHGGILRIWDIKTNTLLEEINPIRPALPIAFSPDNKFLASYSPNGGKNLFVRPTPIPPDIYSQQVRFNEFELALLNVAQGSVEQEYSGFKNIVDVFDASFSADGKQFSYRGTSYDGHTAATNSYEWSISSSTPVQIIQAGGQIEKTSHDNLRIASISGGRPWQTLNLLNAADRNLIKTLDGGYSVAFDISPNGAFLVSINQTSWTDTIHIFSTEDGNLLRTINTPYHDPAYVAFSPDGTMLAVAFQGMVQIWGIDPTK
jgi:WD40 repeat protein